MKQNNIIKETFPLTGEAIDAASARLAAALEVSAGRREGVRIRLAVEEVLTHWRDALGEETVCTLWCGVRFGQRSVKLSAPGPCADPNQNPVGDELDAAGNVILEKLGMSPLFRYEKGVNLVMFQLPAKKPNQLVWIGLASLLAVVLGLLSLSLPTDVRTLLSDELASPALGMLMGALSGVAMPMIFFSICISILNLGDIATLGKIGKKFLIPFLGLTFLTSALTLAAAVWLFPISAGGSNRVAGFQAIFSMLFAIVPGNLISPFLDGNVLQIIFLSGCFGVAFLMLGERTRLVTEVMKQLEQAVSLLMAGINKLIPIFVFFTFYTLAASGAIARLGGAVKLILLVVVLLLLMMLVFTAVLSLRTRVPVGILAAKMAPAFLVALTTASSTASYPTRLETCKARLGLDAQTAHFCVPLAQALFKPSACVMYCGAALCIGAEFGVAITPGWLLMCLLVASILTIASPPVSGGTKIAYAALFAQLGIPVDGLVLVLAAEGVLDFLLTASNTWVQMALNVLCGDELGLVDHAVLAAPDK